MYVTGVATEMERFRWVGEKRAGGILFIVQTVRGNNWGGGGSHLSTFKAGGDSSVLEEVRDRR